MALVRAENVHKSYHLGRTRLPVLRGVNLAIESGSFVAITGASGSGKSTLLHVMGGLDVPQRGQVFFEGREVFEPEGSRRIPVGSDEPSARKAVAATKISGDLRLIETRRNRLRNAAFGFVFQFYHLLPEFDIVENVLLPQMVGASVGGWLADRARTTERALQLLGRVGLGERLEHRPSELSGGERQRVAIARALMNEPAALFADEPTGNLDGKTGRDIFNLLKELNESGQTIAMVTHNRDLARRTDRVVHLVDGRLE